MIYRLSVFRLFCRVFYLSNWCTTRLL